MPLKRIVTFFILTWSITTVIAQRWSTTNTPFITINEVPNTPNADKAGTETSLDYYAEDAAKFGTNYRSILVPINHNYAQSTQDSMIVRAYIGFDSIPQNNEGKVRNYAQIKVDSIFVTMGHQNTSGTSNTIIVSVLSADTNGFPLTHKYWSDTITTNTSLSSGNNWRNTFTQAFACHQIINDYQNFAIEIQYFGNLSDTFGIVAAYPLDGICGTNGNDKAIYSSYYPNSFAYWNQWHLTLPSAAGGDIFYDCDNDDVYADSLDGQNYIQNWKIAAKISSPQIAVPSYTNEPITVFPNPAKDFIQIKGQHLNGKLEIISLEGKLIHQTNVEEDNKSIFVGDLPSGIYIIKLQQLDKIHYAKIVVAH